MSTFYVAVMTTIDEPVTQRSSSLKNCSNPWGGMLFSESSSVWLECVLWEYEVAGSNPVFPMPNVILHSSYVYPLGSIIVKGD